MRSLVLRVDEQSSCAESKVGRSFSGMILVYSRGTTNLVPRFLVECVSNTHVLGIMNVTHFVKKGNPIPAEFGLKELENCFKSQSEKYF